MVRLYPFKSLYPNSASESGESLSRLNDIISSPPKTSVLLNSFETDMNNYSKPRTENDSCVDICDRFEATHASVAPVMVVSPDRALSSRLGVTLQSLREHIDFGLLSESSEDSFYIYSLNHDDHVQIGICAAIAVDDYRQNKIKGHEKTTKSKQYYPQSDTTKNPNIGPIMVMYRESKDVNVIVDSVIIRKPQVTVEHESITHRIWAVSDKEEVSSIQSLFEAVDCLYIADGHHRAANASRRVHENSLLMAVVFPHTQLRILPYHRCLKSIGNCSTSQFLSIVSQSFSIERLSEFDDPTPTSCRSLSMFLDNHWYRLKILGELTSTTISTTSTTTISSSDSHNITDSGGTEGGPSNNNNSHSNSHSNSPCNSTTTTTATILTTNCCSENPVKSLDVQILHDRLLRPFVKSYGCSDVTDNITFVGGPEGAIGLERRVRSGEAVVAFCLREVSVEKVMEVADAGYLMPPKATWFDPKLLSGLFVTLN